MGNRGCLHDDEGRIVRTSSNRAWISCMPRYPGIRRTLMAPGCYTELFFLDEATALAAGHRPCGSCRPAALGDFKRAWRIAHGLDHLPRVSEIDAVLATQRATRTLVNAASLPDGAMIAKISAGTAWLRWQSKWRRWSFEGYSVADQDAPDSATSLLTPAAVVATLAAGYRPSVHGSAG